MFNKTPGQRLQINRSDLINIKRVSIENNFNRRQNRVNDNSDFVYVVSNFDETISKGSVVGIDSSEDQQFFYRAIDYVPPFEGAKLNKLVQYRYRQQLDDNQIFQAVHPTYRNHQGLFGILTENLNPDEGVWAQVSGQAVARINIKTKINLDLLPLFKDYLTLNPDVDFQKDNEDTIISLVYDEDRDPSEDYGSARLLHPTVIEKVVDEETDPVTVTYFLPEGNQLAIVSLGGSLMTFWKNYLWHQGTV